MPNAVNRVSTPPAGTRGATHSSRRGATALVAMAHPSRSDPGPLHQPAGRCRTWTGVVRPPAAPPAPGGSPSRRLVLAGLLGRVGLLLGRVHRAVGVLRRAVDGVEHERVRAGVR